MTVPVTFKSINKQIGTTPQVIYQAPTRVTSIITAGTVVNVSDSQAANLSVNLVPAGDVPGDDNLVLVAETIAEKEDYLLETVINHTLEPGESLQAIADFDALLTMRISVKEIS